MIEIARSWRVLAGGLAIGAMGVAGFAGATASADPAFPPIPIPVPAPVAAPAPSAVTQTATVTPGPVGNRALGAPSTAPSPVASPFPVATPGPSVVAPTPIPASSGTLRDYLQAKAVKLQPQKPQDLKTLSITLPMPPRWTSVPDPNVPDAFAVIADRSGASLYTSNAQVVVYKLVGDFDPTEAITHGYIDSQQLPAWQTTNSSLANFGAFPSSIIEGTYRQNDMTLNTSRRHVIATSGSDKYLVSLAVTTALTQAVADGPATDAIVNGFQVTATAPSAAAAAAPSAPAATPAPPTPPAATPAPVPLLTLTPSPVPLLTLTPAPAPAPAPAAAAAAAAAPSS